MFKRLIKGLILFLLWLIWVVPETNSRFSDIGQSQNSSFTAGDWTRPNSEIVSTEELSNQYQIEIEYEADDNSLAQVELWYSFNEGEWRLFGTDTPHSVGRFYFTSPEGDGVYRFLTVAIDGFGNVEDKNQDGEGDNASQEDLEEAFAASSGYQIQVDTEPPYTVLSLGEFGDDEWGENRFATQELLANGNFEDDTNPSSGWVLQGDGEHRVVDDTDLVGEAETKNADRALLLGWLQEPLDDGVDSAYQIIPLPAASFTLSFWYRVISEDMVDYDWFEVKVIDDSNLANYETIIRTGSSELDGWVGDSGWREITHSLADWAGRTVRVWFAVFNHDDPNLPARTFALVDDVRITSSDNFVTPNKEIEIRGNDPGSGVESTYYRVNDGEWEEVWGEASFASSDYGVGDDETAVIDYYSVDLAGNQEATQSLVLRTDEDKEYFRVVLNKISPKPSGGNRGDSGLPLDGEWVEIWNNSDSEIDLSGWFLRDYNGDVLAVDGHADNDGDLYTTETSVPAGGWLRVYRNGSSLFNLPDEGGEVLLFDASGVLVDSFRYGEVLVSDKVWRRVPDGVGTWTDPKEEEIKTELSYYQGKVVLLVENLPPEAQGSYEIFYKSEGMKKGLFGKIKPEDIREGRVRKELVLGSCSGEDCVFDKIDDRRLVLNLKFGRPDWEEEKEFSW